VRELLALPAAIVPVAVRFFDLQTNKLNLTLDDGRHFLNRCRKQYDVVVLDAFLGDSSPAHLMTREAFAAIRRVLRPGGVLIINAFCRTDAGRDFFGASLDQTLKAVFASVYMHGNGDQSYFVATDRAGPEFLHPPEPDRAHPAVNSLSRRFGPRTGKQQRVELIKENRI